MCKCHGVSGSCTVKTCYKTLPVLRTIGATLQKRYTVAVEVTRPRRRNGVLEDPSTTQTSQQLGLQQRQQQQQLVAAMTLLPVGDEELVYYTISPDYCLPDPALGSTGTKDRLFSN